MDVQFCIVLAEVGLFVNYGEGESFSAHEKFEPFMFDTPSLRSNLSHGPNQGLLCYQACHYEILVGPTFLNRNQNLKRKR